MNFLVTGASGFIGGHLVNTLVKEGHKVKVLVRSTSSYNPQNAEIIKGDLSNLEALNQATKDIDIVIHSAALVDSIDKENFLKTNVEGTRNIVNASIKNKIKKFIYISTCDVMFDPQGLYGGTKLQGEKIVENSGLTYISLRPNTVYGNGGDRGVSKLKDLVKKSFFVPLIGDGNYLLQPIYIQDLCKCILEVSKNGIKNDVFELGGPTTISYKDLVKLITKELKLKRINVPIPLPIVKFGADVISKFKDTSWNKEKISKLGRDKAMDTSRMVNELKVNPITIQEGIKLIVRN